MPDYSFYSTGTATVANGSTAVTFQGAGAIAAAVRVGDVFGTHKGRPIRIAAIAADNTGLTLANPWPEASQTNAPYEIQHTPYDAGLPQQLQKIIDRLTSGNVSALADLQGAADLLPYFTGAGAMDLAQFNAAAREILRGEGRLGVGASIIANWDAIDGNGWWQGVDAANAPGSGWWLGRAMRHTADFIVVEATDFVSSGESDSRTWRREKKGGTWGSWYRLRLSQVEQDNRYPQRDAITDIGLADGNPDAPYMRRSADASLILLQRALGYTPVRQGTGPGQLSNTVSIGHDGSVPRISIDGSDFGSLWTSSQVGSGTEWTRLPNGWLMQKGSSVINFDGAGLAAIILPVSFSGGYDYTSVAWDGDVGGSSSIVNHYSNPDFPQAGGFLVKVTSHDGVPMTGLRRINWIAMGR